MHQQDAFFKFFHSTFEVNTYRSQLYLLLQTYSIEADLNKEIELSALTSYGLLVVIIVDADDDPERTTVVVWKFNVVKPKERNFLFLESLV